MSKVKKIKLPSRGPKPLLMLGFAVVFGIMGAVLLWRIYAAPGACSTANTVGSASYSASVPETAQYRLWVRMQVPETTNTNNLNGVRFEVDSNQCFTVTTTNSNAVNQWQWINYDANAASTPHITTQITQGTHAFRLYGLKAGVKVDKVLLLKSDNTCTPSNDFTNGSPGDNCTTSPPLVTLTSNPTSVSSGGSSTLTWSASDATTCTAGGNWSGPKAASGGSETITNITAARSFTLSCSGPGGTGNVATATVGITPPPAPTVNLSASQTSVAYNGSSTITWSTANATACNATNGASGWSNASKPTNGDQLFTSLTATSTFDLSCSNTSGTTSRSVTVTVAAPPAPTLSITANPTSINSGGSTTLTWSSSNTTTCDASGGWSGNKSTSSNQTITNITSSQTYTLACSGPGGNITRSASVTVGTPPPDTTPPTVEATIPGLTLDNSANQTHTIRTIKEIIWSPQANDNVGLKSFTLTVNGQAATLTGGQVRLGGSANGNGDYVLRAVAVDNSDNTTTKTVTVKLRHPDFDRSGTVGLTDLSRLLANWGLPSTNFDLDASGTVGLFDLSYLLSRWNSTN